MSLINAKRWAKRGAPRPPLVTAEAFAPEPTPVSGDAAPVAVWLSGADDSWCRTRRGVWWPLQGVWVDRLELAAEDVAPTGARTYRLAPEPGSMIEAVHGQVDDDWVSHVLVTGPGGQVLTQGSARAGSSRERALLVLATLIAAAGHGNGPEVMFRACASEKVVHDLEGESWERPGWSRDVVDLPGRVGRVLGLNSQ